MKNSELRMKRQELVARSAACIQGISLRAMFFFPEVEPVYVKVKRERNGG
jgi:hypothetical protein